MNRHKSIIYSGILSLRIIAYILVHNNQIIQFNGWQKLSNWNWGWISTHELPYWWRLQSTYQADPNLYRDKPQSKFLAEPNLSWDHGCALMTLLHISSLNGNKFVHISVKSKLSHHNLITNTQKQGSLKPTDFFSFSSTTRVCNRQRDLTNAGYHAH